MQMAQAQMMAMQKAQEQMMAMMQVLQQGPQSRTPASGDNEARDEVAESLLEPCGGGGGQGRRRDRRGRLIKKTKGFSTLEVFNSNRWSRFRAYFLK